MPRIPSIRSIALCGTALAVALATNAGAAAPKPGLHVPDAAGDANGINSQGFGLPVPSQSTSPASVSGADITAVDFFTTFVGKGRARRAAGFDVRMSLAAPLQQGVTVVVTMTSSVPCGETNVIQLGAGTESLAICQTSGTSTSNDTIGSTAVSADKKTITWSIAPIFRAGTKITNLSAMTTVFVLGVFDEVNSTKVFTYGK